MARAAARPGAPLLRLCRALVRPLLALALLLAVAAVARGPDARAAVEDFVIVAIGDSYFSGEGNPDVPQVLNPDGSVAQPAVWQDARCHRSALAGPSLAAAALQQARPDLRVRFASFACSGATVPVGLIGPYAGAVPPPGQPPLPSQLDQAASWLAQQGLSRIDALVVSIGGNDANFAALVAACAVAFFCYTDPGTIALRDQGLAVLAGRYDQLAAAIASRLTVGRVYLTEYPDPTRNADGTYCGGNPPGDILALLETAEVQWAHQTFLVPLNARIAEAAARHAVRGWRHIGGLAAAFVRHGYCAPATGPNDRWLLTAGDSVRVQGPVGFLDQILTRGTLHPNGRGQAAYRDRLLAVATPLIGGRDLRIATGPLRLTWAAGTLQTGYAVVRADLATGASTTFPAAGLLPATTTNFTDPAPDGAQFPCYVAIAAGTAGAVGVSDLLCAVDGLQAGAGAPGGFTLALEQSPLAHLSWMAPTVAGVAALRLHVFPFAGAGRSVHLPASVTSATDDTGGQPQCYLLVAEDSAGGALGNTDLLCGIPGASNFTMTGVGGQAVTARSAAAAVRGPLAAVRQRGNPRAASEAARRLLRELPPGRGRTPQPSPSPSPSPRGR
jgi:hypothetical protein